MACAQNPRYNPDTIQDCQQIMAVYNSTRPQDVTIAQQCAGASSVDACENMKITGLQGLENGLTELDFTFTVAKNDGTYSEETYPCCKWIEDQKDEGTTHANHMIGLWITLGVVVLIVLFLVAKEFL